MPAWATAHAKECTDAELDELYSVNSGNAAVRDAIEAETARRKGSFSDQPPADTAAAADIEPDPKEARRLYKVARDAMAAGDHAAAVRARLDAAPHLDEKAAAAFDALLNPAQDEAA